MWLMLYISALIGFTFFKIMISALLNLLIMAPMDCCICFANGRSTQRNHGSSEF